MSAPTGCLVHSGLSERALEQPPEPAHVLNVRRDIQSKLFAQCLRELLNNVLAAAHQLHGSGSKGHVLLHDRDHQVDDVPGIQRIRKNASSETMNSVGMIRTTRLMM